MDNQELINEILQEVRIWNMGWITWNVTKVYGKPKSIEDFSKNLSDRYIIKKV
jgi:hypothetical protein